jgi:DNA ligase D
MKPGSPVRAPARARTDVEAVIVDDHEVTITHPAKVLFPRAGYTKLDIVRYYLDVADGALRGSGGRPNVLLRFPDGIDGESFYQKRAPKARPAGIDVATIRFPSGRSAEEIVPRNAASLAWMANLACLELHPHPVRADDLDHPDELRVDLDPVEGVPWSQVQAVAGLVEATLADFGLRGWPKTSGKRGIHVNVRIRRDWTFDEVRRAALALAREIERRAPKLATTRWWKEERRGVFIDYNQNARDRTVAGAYSVRPTPDARVSAPLLWDEVPRAQPGDFTIVTMRKRYLDIGDPHRDIDAHPCSLDSLLELSRRQAGEGQGDAPWPPQYAKAPGEPPRVQPSRRAKKTSGAKAGVSAAPRRKPSSRRKAS